jgi:hypothetical protein
MRYVGCSKFPALSVGAGPDRGAVTKRFHPFMYTKVLLECKKAILFTRYEECGSGKKVRSAGALIV